MANKKGILLGSGLVLTVGVAVFLALAPKTTSAVDDAETSVQPRNQTIEIYKEKLAGKSEEDFSSVNFQALRDNEFCGLLGEDESR